MNARGFHVFAALEGSLGLEAIQEALPNGTPVRAVSLAEAGLAGSEIPPGADLVVVGCSQSHDQAVEVIAAASAQRADRPVVVLYHGSPNGFLQRRSRPAPMTSSSCRSPLRSWGSRSRRHSHGVAAPLPAPPRGK